MRASLLLVIALLLALVFVASSGVASGQASAPRCVGVLWIPRIGLDACIVAAPLVDRVHQVPARDAGHAEGTAWLQHDRYNVVLIGHNPGVFSRLGELEAGDMLYIFDVATTAEYEVIDVYVTDASNTAPLDQTTEPTATLVTCTPDDQRLIIRAQRVQ